MKITIKRPDSFAFLFARLQKRAKKLGLEVPSYVVTAERMETADVFEICEGETRKTGTVQVLVHDVEISGIEPVKLPGWNFAARLETVKGGDNLVYSVPGVEVPARFSKSGCVCDHCRMNRQRNNTYVVRHAESGDWKQVGSTCLADFVGGDGAERLAQIFEFFGQVLIDLDSFCRGEAEGWEGCEAAYDLRHILGRSIEYAEKFGWMSRTKAREAGENVIATADRVLLSLKDDRSPVSEEALAKAETAIAYFAGLGESAIDDNLTRNARVIANAGFCSKKSFGLGCALWVCYRVAMDRVDREARREHQRKTAVHLGTIGERRKGWVATVKRIFTYESQWGVSVKSILEDDSGNVLVCKDIADEGQRVRFTATVKEHSEWDGVKQTVLLRAANIEILSA